MDYKIQDTTLTAIADAINAKIGETGQMTPLQMPEKIASIPSGRDGTATLTYTFERSEGQLGVATPEGVHGYAVFSGGIIKGDFTSNQGSVTIAIPQVVYARSMLYFNGSVQQIGSESFYLVTGDCSCSSSGPVMPS